MVTISNGKTFCSVTMGAFNNIYKKKGFYIVKGTPRVTKQPSRVEKSVEVPKVKEEPVAVAEEPVIEEVSEKEWVTELLEKPISQWTKEEVSDFVKEKNIDTSSAHKLSEVKAIIKDWLDEQNRI